MSTQLYLKDDLRERGIPYCDHHLRRLEAQGKFPARFKIVPGATKQGRVAWDAEAIDSWLAERGAA